jgi:hypothetical protein
MADRIIHGINIERLAEQVKAEILKDIGDGTIPQSVRSFSELHDYVDANTYGDAEQMVHEIGIRKAIDVCNAFQPIVDTWLHNGRVLVIDGWEDIGTGGGCTALYKPTGEAVPISCLSDGAVDGGVVTGYEHWLMTSCGDANSPSILAESVDLGYYPAGGGEHHMLFIGIPDVPTALAIVDGTIDGNQYLWDADNR